MTTLEQRLQKVSGIVGELVENQVANSKISKASCLHQPAQVGRGNGFPAVESARRQSSRFLLVGKRFGLRSAAKSFHLSNLFESHFRQLIGARRVSLNAKTESSCGVKRHGRISLGFSPALERDKPCNPARRHVSHEPIVDANHGLVRAIPEDKVFSVFQQAGFQGCGVPIHRRLLLSNFGRRRRQSRRDARRSVGAVHQVAGRRDRVEEESSTSRGSGEAVSQTSSIRVQPLGQQSGHAACIVVDHVDSARTVFLVTAIVDASLVVIVKVKRCWRVDVVAVSKRHQEV